MWVSFLSLFIFLNFFIYLCVQLNYVILSVADLFSNHPSTSENVLLLSLNLLPKISQLLKYYHEIPRTTIWSAYACRIKKKRKAIYSLLLLILLALLNTSIFRSYVFLKIFYLQCDTSTYKYCYKIDRILV